MSHTSKRSGNEPSSKSTFCCKNVRNRLLASGTPILNTNISSAIAAAFLGVLSATEHNPNSLPYSIIRRVLMSSCVLVLLNLRPFHEVRFVRKTKIRMVIFLLRPQTYKKKHSKN